MALKENMSRTIRERIRRRGSTPGEAPGTTITFFIWLSSPRARSNSDVVRSGAVAYTEYTSVLYLRSMFLGKLALVTALGSVSLAAQSVTPSDFFERKV